MPRLAIPAAWTAVAVAAIVAAASTSENAAASPILVHGVWRIVLIAAVTGALMGYVAALLVVAKVPHVGVALVVAAVIQLVPLAGPLLLSTDAYSYWAYGRVAAQHGANPYEAPPERFAGDVAVERMGADWRDTPLVYGPIFAWAAEGGAAASGERVDGSVLVHRLLAALSMLALTWAAALRGGAFGAVLVGWNPLLALHAAGGGHNDFPMMALAVAGVLLALRGRAGFGGMLFAASIFVKWTPLILLPLILCRPDLRTRKFVLGVGAAGAAIAVLAFADFGFAWLDALDRLSAQGRRTDGSLGLAPILRDIGLPHRAILAFLALLFVTGYGRAFLDARRGGERVGRGGAVFVLTQGWVNPWYTALMAPFAAIERDVVAHAAVVVLTAYFLADVAG